LTIATQAPDDEAEPGQRGGFLGSLARNWVPLLTAVVGFATAGVGLWAAQNASEERDQLEVTVSERNETVDGLQTSNSSLVDANEQLSEELAATQSDLSEAQSAATTSTTTDGEPPPPEPVQVVRRATDGAPLVVPAYDGFDIDSEESDWGVTADDRDVYVTAGARSLNAASAVLVAVVPAPPSVASCEAQTVVDSGLDEPQTVEGQHLCVRSDEGRWAYVRIVDIDPENDQISFEVTVWKLSTDP
jgi:hypothetical protein